MNMQPMLELLWTPWMMVTQIHKVMNKRVHMVTVVNFYRPPNNRYQALTHLKFILASLKEKCKSQCVILSGDFNLNPTEMMDLEAQLPLRLEKPDDWSQFVSRT